MAGCSIPTKSRFLDAGGARAERTGDNYVGSKPYPWIQWVLDMLCCQPDDELHDLFAGSGAVTLATELTGIGFPPDVMLLHRWDMPICVHVDCAMPAGRMAGTRKRSHWRSTPPAPTGRRSGRRRSPRLDL